MFRKITTFAVVAACGAIALSFANDASARDGGGPPAYVVEKMRKQERAREQRPVSSVERDRRSTTGTKQPKTDPGSCRTGSNCLNNGR